MSDENTNKQNLDQSDWRTAWEQEHEENARLLTRIADLERSAASAREIARATMTHTGMHCVRVELTATDHGLMLIVCDPAGDENALTQRIVRLLDTGLWTQIGMSPAGEVRKVGSSS